MSDIDGKLPGLPSDLAGVVASEFAEIAVSFDDQGNGVRLRLQDMRTGQVRFLDALELETIVWLRDEHLSTLMNPSADRWRDDH
jgi:hypothetical protein